MAERERLRRACSGGGGAGGGGGGGGGVKKKKKKKIEKVVKSFVFRMHYLVAPCSWALFTDISGSICILFTKTHSPFWTHSHLSMLQHTQHLRVYINNGRI